MEGFPIDRTLKNKACIFVIFGATGDLAQRKLFPAVYNLYLDGTLPEEFAVVAIGRRGKTTEELRKELAGYIRDFSRQGMTDPEKWDRFLRFIYYWKLDFTDHRGYHDLKVYLDSLDRVHGTAGNRIFYLAVAPEYFLPIAHHLYLARMVSNRRNWQRVVIEKPFGSDLPSARSLNEGLTQVFEEQNIYRIDHYLGKEMMQNLMVIRFANSLFEPIWNSKYIDHVQINSSETLGVMNRGNYYDKSGALRDMVQNHMLQLLTLTAMEPPYSLDPEAIRDEKVKVLRTLELLKPDQVRQQVVRGQYGRGFIDGQAVVGYREEDKVSPQSDTETFIAMKAEINNFRWAGVPFYIRTGKRLARKSTEIIIQFSKLPGVLYFKEFGPMAPNLLVIRVQPEEGVMLHFNAKRPGSRSEIIPVKMDFCQNCDVEVTTPEAYERLLDDVMRGDSTLFTRWDEVEASWRFVDSISAAWAEEKPAFPNYDPGTWGPREADELLQQDGRIWWNIE